MSTPETFHEVPHRGLITVALMLATIMQALDTTIANVALPHMKGDLGASPDNINWVLTSYIVAAAIMTPVTGWLADRLGRKRTVPDGGGRLHHRLDALRDRLEPGDMVLFRLMQGVFGAAIVPLSQAFLLDINPKERHGQAMAIWGAGIMLGPILGPTLGGWLTENFNWRWVFFINLPVGILAFLGMAAYLPGRRQAAARLRFLRLRHALARHRRAAADARPRRRGRLVLLDRDLDRAWPVAHRLLGVHHPHADQPSIPSSTPRSSSTAISSPGWLSSSSMGVRSCATMSLLPPMLPTSWAIRPSPSAW